MYHFVVVGGGPGGYVAAIRAAQLGQRTALVEMDRVGGSCLNVGCIPSKTLVAAAALYEQVRGAVSLGILRAENLRVQFDVLMAHQSQVVRNLYQGVQHLLRSNGVELLQGRGRLVRAGVVEVTAPDRVCEIKAPRILISTGSRPVLPPVPGLAEVAVTTDKVWDLRTQPESVLILGAGVVGMEFASLFSALGSKVTVVEMLPRILPGADQAMADRLLALLRRAGVQVWLESTLTGVTTSPDGRHRAAVATPGEQRTVEADLILVAAGRRPRLDVLGEAGSLGVRTGPAGIVVDEHFATTCPGVYAVGDVTGGGLAHVATAQALSCVEHLFGKGSHRLDPIPAVVYSLPELAWVGMTEDAACASGTEYRAQSFPYSALGRAHTVGRPAGEVKCLFEPDSGRLLGMHILGEHAGELIHEGVLALRTGATVRDLAEMVHAHPTFAEAVGECAHAALGTPVHTVRRSR